MRQAWSTILEHVQRAGGTNESDNTYRPSKVHMNPTSTDIYLQWGDMAQTSHTTFLSVTKVVFQELFITKAFALQVCYIILYIQYFTKVLHGCTWGCDLYTWHIKLCKCYYCCPNSATGQKDYCILLSLDCTCCWRWSWTPCTTDWSPCLLRCQWLTLLGTLHLPSDQTAAGSPGGKMSRKIKKNKNS